MSRSASSEQCWAFHFPSIIAEAGARSPTRDVACAPEPPYEHCRSLGIGAGVYLWAIRPWQLRWGATDDELRRAMPGDELVARPTFNATRAVSVAAPPRLIWPWIVQIGFGRAGWYAYDLLDNLGRPSATRIIPDLQHLQAGDLVPMYQGIGAPEGSG